jgi:hypothetical protein
MSRPFENLNEADPQVGTGKKPEGSDRRLYTDENPEDTVSVKYRTKEDIVDTLNKPDFKSKSHQRQSQIINLIHQRLSVAVEQAKDPEVIARLKRGLEYIEIQKEKSKEKTQKMKRIKLFEEFINEETSQEGHLLNVLAGMQIGNEPATEFLSKHNVDMEALKKAKMQKVISSYEIRDVIQGKAPKSLEKEFFKNYVK